jgi:hypothetical protein
MQKRIYRIIMAIPTARALDIKAPIDMYEKEDAMLGATLSVTPEVPLVAVHCAPHAKLL